MTILKDGILSLLTGAMIAAPFYLYLMGWV